MPRRERRCVSGSVLGCLMVYLFVWPFAGVCVCVCVCRCAGVWVIVYRVLHHIVGRLTLVHRCFETSICCFVLFRFVLPIETKMLVFCHRFSVFLFVFLYIFKLNQCFGIEEKMLAARSSDHKCTTIKSVHSEQQFFHIFLRIQMENSMGSHLKEL